VRLDLIGQAGFRRHAMIAVSLSAMILAAGPAQARWFFEPEPVAKPGPRTRSLAPLQQGTADPGAPRQGARKSKKGAKTTAVAKAPEKMPAGPLSILISIKQQRLTVYANGQPFAHSPVSTGVPGHPTPQGVFSVIQKNLHHRSNLYSDAPMPYMQRITWSGVAMHEGRLPGYPASHGCIRLPREFAQRLWGMTRIGARVIIAQDEVTPAEISHTRLAALNLPVLSAAEPPSRIRLATAAPGGMLDTPLKGTIDDNESNDARIERAIDSAVQAGMAAADAFVDIESAPARVPDKTGVVASAKDPLLKPGPISIYISRKNAKLYVRKGFDEVLEVPVTIAQPDQPLGTHVFSALKADGENVRWNVVSLPTQRLVKNGKYLLTMHRGEKLRKELVPPVYETVPPGNAHVALDRITIPEATLARINALMSPGASLIISDLGLSYETGKGTDFIVLTR
jgi:lipoprotein-anchoring transpeptidase ErfK/SrfK